MSEQGVDIDEVPADGGFCEVEADGDIDESDPVPAMFGQDGAPEAQNVVSPFAFAIGEEFG